MEEVKKIKKEVAVIFKKKKEKNGLVYQYPVTVAMGYLDEEKKVFKTKREEFHYALDNEYVYGFALRMSLREFVEKFKEDDETLKDVAIAYLKDLKKYKYMFITQNENSYDDIYFVAQEKKTERTSVLEERDIDIGKCILNEALPLNKVQKNNDSNITFDFDAKKLSDVVKQTVIGQDEIVDEIVTVIWQNFRSNNKSNILLMGPTGTGKTEIIRTISNNLGVPMASFNITDTSQAAYIGTKLSDVIVQLVKNANNDIKKASKGIVFIDEIDKKAGFGEFNSGTMTTGVQDELLKLLEDNDYEVNISDDPLLPKMVTINTKDITFICAGAFSNINEEVKEIEQKSTIGFITSSSSKENKTKAPKKKITRNDLVKYGLKAELVGRLHNIIQLNSLTHENLIQIMKNPNNKTIEQKRKILESLGIKLNLEEEVYEILADRAIKNNTGARGLISAVDDLFMKAMQEILFSPSGFEELSITKETAQDNKAYKLVRKNK